jgi:hypothetical protein
MVDLHPHFITDTDGKRISVVLSIREYEAILEELEDQEDVRLFDNAKKENDPSYPLEEAIRLIQSDRASE